MSSEKVFKRQLSSGSIEKHSDSKDHKHQLGVLLTGYLQKQNPYGKAYRSRFVVLTQEAFHWFKVCYFYCYCWLCLHVSHIYQKQENDHLFGEERGQVSLKSIETVRILDEDPTQFELLTENFTRRYFRCRDEGECEEWVSAIRSAVKTISAEKVKRRQSVYNSEGQKFIDPTDESGNIDIDEVKVILVSHLSKSDGVETVIARNPGWDRLIFLKNICNGDSVVISTSNGGTITLSHSTIQDKASMSAPFDTAIQNVLLASSLRTLLIEEPHTLEQALAPVKKRTMMSQVVESFNEVSQDQRSVEILTLSLMVAFTALKAFISMFSTDVESSLSLFVALAVVLAGSAAVQVPFSSHAMYHTAPSPIIALFLLQTFTVSTSRSGHPPPRQTGDNFHLTIIEHQYTSPDAPVKAPEDEIPIRFLNGCDQDIREARRRWDITRKWREENVRIFNLLPRMCIIEVLYIVNMLLVTFYIEHRQHS
jgi:hypothetical protein